MVTLNLDFYRYSQKKLISSWISTLEKVNSSIVCITTPVPHILEKLSENNSDSEIILCDIELSNTTIFRLGKGGELISTKLPYGTELYISDKLDSDVNKFFNRLQHNIDRNTGTNFLNDLQSVYLFGNGIDALIESNNLLPKGYRLILDTNIDSFKYSLSNEVKETENISSIISSMAHITTLALQEE